MARAALAQIDWSGAVARAGDGDAVLAAAVNSLAALFAGDCEAGIALLMSAREHDPFNPLHDLRLALFLARFGDLGGAGEVLHRLQQRDLPAPIIPYLRALFALRAGRADQARSIAAALATTHPDFLAAQFLRAEAQIVMTARPASVERHLRPLPAGPEWEPAWADLLVKLALLHPDEGPALAARHAEKRLTPGTPLRAALDKAMAWAGASVEQLCGLLQEERPNSSGETLLLGTLLDRLRQAAREAAAPDERAEEAVRLLSAQVALHPGRPALRHLLHSFQTQRAALLAGAGRYEEALRFAERGLDAAPHDPIYHQNLAALFTLMRESEAYHGAWASLNAHQYRLVLLGLADPVIGQIVKTHRLFAQQSRGGAETRERGIFRAIEFEGGDRAEIVDGDRLATDPDLLRQWFHHKRAELVFRHLAVGADGRRRLLDPADVDEARLRADGLTGLCGSLAVLVREEGGLLAERLAGIWSAAAAAIDTRYAAPRHFVPDDEDEALGELKEEHLCVLADLCMICRDWRPGRDLLWVAEDILEWLEVEVDFADLALLARLRAERGHTLSYPLRLLAAKLDDGRGSGGLSEDVRAVAEPFMGQLLLNMSYTAFDDSPASDKDRVAEAMTYVDRARRCQPAESRVELAAAEYLAFGDYLEDSRSALKRYRRLAGPDDAREDERADNIEKLLADKQRDGKGGEKFERDPETEAVGGDAARVAELLAEIDRAPTSSRLYAALVKELVLAERLDEAVAWADRCVAQCLARSEQINARSLALEARGLKALAAISQRAAKLYSVGAHEAALRILETQAAQPGAADFPLLYILGQCQLKSGLPDAADASFRAAAALCDRSIYRAALRQLTGDIDQAYLAVASANVHELVRAGKLDEAVDEACGVFGRLRQPARWLVDFARFFCAVALGRLQAGGTSEPRVDFEADWRPRLNSALAAPDDVERALAVAEIARDLRQAAADQAQAVIERAHALRRQLASLTALKEAGHLLNERRFEATLALLDGLDPAIASEPRLRRLKLLALLGAQRFQEADAAFAHFGATDNAELQAFLEGYPARAFRQRIAFAQQKLRESKAGEVLEALRDLAAPGPKEEAELAYCRAFATTLEAYAARKGGDRAGALARFERALSILDPHVRGGDAPAYVAELFERLDMEADRHD